MRGLESFGFRVFGWSCESSDLDFGGTELFSSLLGLLGIQFTCAASESNCWP